ncbi:MAG TPA: histone deacetylase [Bryobacteraceae bacterium]|nr:histone deacetylase [Bryobacteraceae bacterium]
MRVYYCDHHEIPLPPGHKFPLRKYRLIREALESAGGFDLQPAPSAPIDVIELAHDPEYVRAFVEGTLASQAMRRIGFPWSAGLVQRTLASAGSTLQCAHDVFERGIAGGLAGGTHHAFYAEGSGFCVFNDIAIAIRALRREGRIRRAAVVDLDVHQGDGTAAIFSGDADVLTFSMHGANNFPFRKQQSAIDVELTDGTGDAAYLERLEATLPRVWGFEPEILFFQAGVDALKTDRLGRLALTHAGLEARDRLVLEGARRRKIPVVITLGGGYSEPIEATVEVHANTFRMAARSLYNGSCQNAPSSSLPPHLP